MKWMCTTFLRASMPRSSFEPPYHVKAERRLDDRADLADIEREGRVGKSFHHLVAREFAERAAARRTTRLVGVRRYHLVEVLPSFDGVEGLERARPRRFLGPRDGARRRLGSLVHHEQML